MKIRHWMLLMKDLKSLQKNKHTGKQAGLLKVRLLYTGVGNMSDILYRKQKKYYFLLVLPALCIYTFALAGPLIFGTDPEFVFQLESDQRNA